MRLSNIGYLLLGLVVEALEQQPYHVVVHQRIAGPLGLHHSRALQPNETSTPALATPHQVQAPRPDPAAWQRLGNGNIVATADDVLRFWQALLSGRLLPLAVVLYAPEAVAFVAVAVNNAVSAPAVANALLKVLAEWH